MSNAGIFYASAFSSPIAGFTLFEVYSSALLVCLVLVVTRELHLPVAGFPGVPPPPHFCLRRLRWPWPAGINGLRAAAAAPDDRT